jgi:F-type H+-transporting ATPase subunit a
VNAPLQSTVYFTIGPLPITQAIVTTWGIMLVLVCAAFLLTRQLSLRPGKRQAAIELIVEMLDTQIRETSGV